MKFRPMFYYQMPENPNCTKTSIDFSAFLRSNKFPEKSIESPLAAATQSTGNGVCTNVRNLNPDHKIRSSTKLYHHRIRCLYLFFSLREKKKKSKKKRSAISIDKVLSAKWILFKPSVHSTFPHSNMLTYIWTFGRLLHPNYITIRAVAAAL